MAREKTLAKKETGEVERWDPWDTFQEMERMFRDFFTSPFSLMRPRWRMRPMRFEYAPDVDLRETEKEFVLSATFLMARTTRRLSTMPGARFTRCCTPNPTLIRLYSGTQYYEWHNTESVFNDGQWHRLVASLRDPDLWPGLFMSPASVGLTRGFELFDRSVFGLRPVLRPT